MTSGASIAGQQPFAPGTSPFKIKGNGYQSQLDYLDHNVPDGSAAVIASIRDPAARAFLTQKFITSGWYDALPIVPLVESASVAIGVTHTEMCRRLGRWAAQRDIPGIYRFLLKLASPEGLVQRFPKSSKLYFNFVDLEVEPLRARAFEIRQRGVPAVLQTVYQYAVEAFRLTALESAGARNVRTRWLAPEPLGDRDGVPIVLLRCDLSWT